MNHSFLDAFIFKDSSNFKQFFLDPDIPLIIETELIYQKRDPVLKLLNIVFEWITENSRPVTELPIFTAIPLLLECYRVLPSLYIDEQTGLITVITNFWKTITKFHEKFKS